MDFPSQPYPIYSDPSPSHEQARRSMPFAMPVSSYFRRPSRITKPARNQSPKHLARRRTTAATHGHPRHPSMDQMSRRTPATEAKMGQERPLSWHPTSYEQPIDLSQYPQINYFPQFDFSASPFTTAEINGLITPMSAPVPNEPQIQEFMTTLGDYSPLPNSTIPFNDEYVTKMGSSYYPSLESQPLDQNYVAHHTSYDYPYALPQTYHMQPTSWSHLNVDTAPPSPMLLPVHHFDEDGSASPFVLGSPRVEKEELVGMGLYDRPQDVQSSMLFGNEPLSMAALTAGIGRGLKLEESFEPPPAEDDDEDNEAEEEEEEDEEEAEEQDEPQDPIASAVITNFNMVPPQVYVEDQSNYTGPTFFFEDKDSRYAVPTGAEINYPYYTTSQWMPESQPYGWI